MEASPLHKILQCGVVTRDQYCSYKVTQDSGFDESMET